MARSQGSKGWNSLQGGQGGRGLPVCRAIGRRSRSSPRMQGAHGGHTRQSRAQEAHQGPQGPLFPNRANRHPVHRTTLQTAATSTHWMTCWISCNAMYSTHLTALTPKPNPQSKSVMPFKHAIVKTA